MSDEKEGFGGVAGAIQNGLGWLAGWCFSHYKQTLIVVFAALGLSLFLARTLSLRADLSELLPPTFESVKALEKLKKQFGGVGYVAVMATGKDKAELERFASDLAPKLEALDTVSYVDLKRPREFFEDRVLMYLDKEDVQVVSDRLVERLDFEVAKRAFDIFDEMDEEEPPTLDFSDLEEKYKSKSGSSWASSQSKSLFYISEDGTKIAVLAKPAQSSTDLSFSRRIVDDVKRVVGETDLASYGVTVEFGGNFTKKVDQQEMITRDLGSATGVAFVLIILYLMWHFRRIAAVALVTVPLLIGLIWTYGVAAAVFGTLNIMTGFIGAILLGLGIDHGIHLLGRYASSHQAPSDDGPLSMGTQSRAVAEAFGHTGRAVMAAAVTTLVGFAGLGFSDFRAFREFGILAAVGVGLIVLSYVTLMPALLGAATRFGWQPKAHIGTFSVTYARLIQRFNKPAAAVFLLLLVGIGSFLGRASFDYDFRSLTASNLPSFRMDAEIDGVLGHSQTPVVVLAQTDEEEQTTAAALRARKIERGESSTIHLVAAGSDLIPKDQAAKHELLAPVRKRMVNRRAKDFEGEEREQFLRLKRMLAIEPFDRDTLPGTIRRRFYGEGELRFVLVYASVDLSQGENVSRFAAELRGLQRPDGTPIVVAGAPMVLADIFDLIKNEAPPVLMGTLVLVFFAMWLMLGRLSMALMALLPASASLLITFGLMGLIGLPFNYLNIVMVPVLFGTGVDGGVHLVSRSDGSTSTETALSETGSSIAGALTTTGFGFGALTLADHLGLNSMGYLAVLGLSANLVSCLLGLPPILDLRDRWRQRQRASTAPTD
jgi:uncharacterized protein